MTNKALGEHYKGIIEPLRIKREMRKRSGILTESTWIHAAIREHETYHRYTTTYIHWYIKKLAEKSVNAENEGKNFKVSDSVIADKWGSYYLLVAEGWYTYSNRSPKRRIRSCWLMGKDPDQPSGWFVRKVSSTVKNIQEALVWLEPVKVQRARLAGIDVKRQGDVYILPSKKSDRGISSLPPGHVWDKDKRILIHNQHACLHFPDPVEFIPQKIAIVNAKRYD